LNDLPLDACFAVSCRQAHHSAAMESHMSENEDDDLIIVPLPGSETQAEHDRVRKSNDRDQEMEREGKVSRHNRGYDEAADGPVAPKIERVVDE
jgi:hypothetical protein